MTIEARLTFATQLIREAGQLAARHFAHRKDLTRETKGPQDFVSIADREVESLIRTRLAEAFPADGFLGERVRGGRGAVLGGLNRIDIGHYGPDRCLTGFLGRQRGLCRCRGRKPV